MSLGALRIWLREQSSPSQLYLPGYVVWSPAGLWLCCVPSQIKPLWQQHSSPPPMQGFAAASVKLPMNQRFWSALLPGAASGKQFKNGPTVLRLKAFGEGEKTSALALHALQEPCKSVRTLHCNFFFFFFP